MKTSTILAAICVALTGLAGCAFLGVQPSGDIPEVADIIDEYLAIKVVSETEPDDDDLFSDVDRASGSSLFFALSAATVTRELDDAGTPDDPTDDTITVTRERTEWNGLSTRHVLTRPARPNMSIAWDGVWDSEMRYIQNGTFAIYLGEFSTPHKTGALRMVWEKLSEIVLIETERSTEYLDGTGAVVEEVVSIDPDSGLKNRTETRYRVVGQDTIIVSVSESEQLVDEETGELIRRDITSDRREGYALVRLTAESRVVEYYTNDDVLQLIVTQVRNAATGRLEIRRDFYSEGVIVRSVEGTVRYRFENGVLTMVRERSDGVSRTIAVAETDEGFRVEKDGITYYVVVDNGQMTIEFGNASYVLERSSTGAWGVVG